MSVREVLTRLFAPPAEGEDPTPLFKARLAARSVWASKWYLLIGAAVLFILQVRWYAPAWFVEQLSMLPPSLVSPITAGQFGDVNFWGGQIIGVALLSAGTYFLVSMRELWESWLLENLFLLAWQRAVFKHMLMSAVQDEMAMFLARQVSMLSSRFFVPDVYDVDNLTGSASASASGDAAAAGVLAWETYRGGIDGALRIMWYAFTGLVWTGLRVGLFAVPLRFQPVARRLGYALHFFGVATFRIYPAFNSAGVDIVSGLRILMSVYPLACIVFGAAAVLPGMYAGDMVKSRVRGTLAKIFAIYVVQIVCVMWATHAGRAIGAAMLEQEAVQALAPLNLTVIAGGRLWLAILLGLVGIVYAHAANVLYLSSPLFLCEWGVPTVGHITITDDASVQRHLRLAFQDVMLAIRHWEGAPEDADSVRGRGRDRDRDRERDDAAGGSGPGRDDGAMGPDGRPAQRARGRMRELVTTAVSFGRHLLGTYTGVRRLMRGRGRVSFDIPMSAEVVNSSDRTFVMQPVRIEVTTRRGGPLSRQKKQSPLLVIGVDRIKVAPTTSARSASADGGAAASAAAAAAGWSTGTPARINFGMRAILGVDTLCDLSVGKEPMKQLEVTMYAGTSLSTFEFAVPLVSYQDGDWRSVFEQSSAATRSSLSELPMKLDKLRGDVTRFQSQLLRHHLSAAEDKLQQDLAQLDAVLARLSRAHIDEEDGPGEAVVLDLMTAAYHIVSIFTIERESGGDHADVPAAFVALEQTALVLMNQFYAVVTWQMGVSRDPMHLVVLSCLMAVAQGLLHPGDASEVVSSLAAPTTDEDDDAFARDVVERARSARAQSPAEVAAVASAASNGLEGGGPADSDSTLRRRHVRGSVSGGGEASSADGASAGPATTTPTPASAASAGLSGSDEAIYSATLTTTWQAPAAVHADADAGGASGTVRELPRQAPDRVHEHTDSDDGADDSAAAAHAGVDDRDVPNPEEVR